MNAKPKVLIAYDGSEGADAALYDLKLAGLPSGTEAIVMSVGELSLSFPPSYGMVETDFAERYSASLQEAQALASKAHERLQSLFTTWKVDHEAGIGSVAGEILTKAETWKPDLIVLGSHGRSRLSRFMFGSISQQIVTEAHCSVRISRKTLQEEDHPVRLIIGLDGSASASAAVEIVATRLWPKGSAVRLVTATSSENMEELTYAQNIQASPKAELSSAGLSVSSLIKEGDPKTILLHEAERFNADCIFLGARGINRLRRLLLGSVSTAIVARAHCSVEIVRKEE